MRGVNINGWLNRRSTPTYALVIAGTVFPASLVAGGAVQWLWHSHLDLSTLTGATVGCTLAAMVMAVWHRSNQRARQR